MGKRLADNISSQYIAAANLLRSKKARKKIVAYVESYDDVFFWRTLLSEFENDEYYFEVMLPSSESLVKGKKAALMNSLGSGLGQNMIACVDADYDYLLQDSTNTSRQINHSQYVFHTYAYAIENFQCYAESLHDICVQATLNDRVIIDLPIFMKLYSQTIFPLFAWSIWFYRKRILNKFSITDFNNTVRIDTVNLRHPEEALNSVANRVRRKLNWLENRFSRYRNGVDTLQNELKQLGVAPETTYLFIQGHNLFENVVLKLLYPICAQLRRERELEIKMLAEHNQQMQNELTCYQHSQTGINFILKKNTAYKDAPLYQRLRDDIRHFLDHLSSKK
ncbi:MAG: DUF4435 domain-containing protein [Bacteroidaceae bacterium]|nr:DUF4435 domain-containing protein [Bacteroidaceae bacterium]